MQNKTQFGQLDFFYKNGAYSLYWGCKLIYYTNDLDDFIMTVREIKNSFKLVDFDEIKEAFNG